MNEKRKTSPVINSGTMADVAFLLLIFFLVTTTISTDYGISTTLSSDYKDTQKYETFVTEVLINRQGQILANDQLVKKNALSAGLLTEFNASPGSKNVIMVKTEREVPFDHFIGVLNESKRSFRLFHEERSLDMFNKQLSELNEQENAELMSAYPCGLMEDVMD